MTLCKNCGSQNEDNATFCNSCGSSLEMTFGAGAQQPDTQPTARPYSSHQTPQQPNEPQEMQPPQPQQQPYQPQQPPQPPQPPYQSQQPPRPPQPPQPYQPPQPQQPYQQHQYTHGQPGIDQTDDKYRKLGGWLLFIVIINIVFSAIDVVASFSGLLETVGYFAELSEQRQYLPDNFETALYLTLIGEIVGLLSIVFTILFIVNVFTRKPTFLLFAQITYFVSMFYTIFVGIIPNAMLGEDFAQNITPLVSNITGIIIFTAYMCKSVRVRTYMGSTEYMKKAIFSFKPFTPPQPTS